MPLSPDPEKAAIQKANLKRDAGPGRPKGSRNWSTVTKQLLDDPELFKKLLDSMERKPAWLKDANPETLMDAITIAQSLKALSGSHFSAEWVRKTGWGDKVDITSGGEKLTMEPIVISTIKPRNIIEAEIVQPEKLEDGNDSTAQA